MEACNQEGSLKGALLFIGAITLALCTFMQTLDSSIANVSIPDIAGDLAASVSEGTWVITLFAVGNAIALPLTGFFSRRFGAIRIMCLSVGLFSLFSLLCGLSFSLPMLVVMRFFQGFVAGPLIPLSQSLMVMTFPKEKKNLALAIWNMVAILGPVIGPILGGWITFNFSWPWIFLINIPIGIFCMMMIKVLYKSREVPPQKVRVDGVGIFLLAVTVTTLQIILDQGQLLDWWDSNLIRLLAGVSFLSLCLFITWERFEQEPIVDLKLFKNRNFLIGTFLTALSYMVIFGTIVVTPLWLQEFMGYNAKVAGLAISSVGIVPFFSVLFVSRLMSKISLRLLVMLSFVCYATVLFFCSTFTSEVSFKVISFSRFFFGVGMAIWLAPLTALTFARISPEKLPMGTGVFHFFRIFMGGIGASLFVTLWERRQSFHHANLASNLNEYNPLSQSFFHTLKDIGIEGEKAFAYSNTVIGKQAALLSLNEIFWLGGWSCIICLLIALFFKRRKKDKRGLLKGEEGSKA